MSDAPQKMDDSEFQSLIEGMATDAADFVDGTLSADRALATKYYMGGQLGNEVEGRSQYVQTVVRDSVLAVLPQALRVIFGAEHPVEFAPRRADTVDQAAQATDYIRYVFSDDNNGFIETHGVWKDGLVRKLGVYKIWWDETADVTTYSLRDVTQSQLEKLVESDEVELLRAQETFPGTEAVVVDGQEAQPAQEKRYDIEVKHTDPEGRLRLGALPPEEFIFSRDGRALPTTKLVGHRTQKTTSELLAMGVKQDEIDEFGGMSLNLPDNEEVLARQQVMGGESLEQSVDAGTANDIHDYAELYPLIDFDGDGIAELRRVCTIGPAYHVVSNDPAPERPFYIFCPDPEPHTLLGQSWADRLMDLQKMVSSIVRANADSLALAITPRTEVVEGEVNMIDLDNPEIGAHVRVKKPGMMREVLHTYVGKESFPLLEFLEDAKEQRTGIDKGSVGLDADALQSTEKAAAGAAIAASQGQVELLVRIFAEMTLKPMFRGMLRLLVAHKPRKRMTKLRGKWVEVNPAMWDANMDVKVNVAMGTALVEKRIAALQGVAAKQELILTTLGPTNPIVTPQQYSNTLRKLVELNGFVDVDSYFTAVPADYQPPPPAQPQVDPMVQVKMQELDFKKLNAQADQQLKMAELTLMQAKTRMEQEQKDADRAQAMQLALEEIRLKLELGMAQIEAEWKTKLAEAQLRARVETTKEIAVNNREIANNKLEHERTVAEVAVDHHHQTVEHEQKDRELDIAQQEADKPTPKPSA